MAEFGQLPPTLIDLLLNTVILRQLAPYIPLQSLLSLSRTSKDIRAIITSQPEPWRYLDLTRVKSAIIDSSPIDVGGVIWRAERMDESLTEDDFYSGPLRGIFSKLHSKHLLRTVQTMILDGLSVPADLVREILAEDRYNVRILSLRESKHLNQPKLQQVLRYLTRPTRAQGTPKLKALYFFGPKYAVRSTLYDHSRQTLAHVGVLRSEGAQIGADWNERSSMALETCISDDEARWYSSTGRLMKRPLSDWPDTLQACKGLIAFDAVLCRGPRHDITKVSSTDFLPPSIAVVALGRGCETCNTTPESPAIFGSSPDHDLPLLSPPPTHSSLVRSAQYPHRPTPSGAFPPLYIRCEDCLRGRWCERCNRWWCEDCYQERPAQGPGPYLQRVEVREDLQRNGWEGTASTAAGPPAVKVYSKLCVEHCLVSEMMSGAGSNGMWG